MDDESLKSFLFFSLIAAMILPFSGMMMAEASNSSIRSPVITKAIETDQLQCDNSEHVLVLRTNGNYACVTQKTSEKMGWEKVTFTKTIDDVLAKVTQLSFADVFIKSEVENADIELGLYSKSMDGKNIREPYLGPLSDYFVIIDSNSLTPIMTQDAAMRTFDVVDKDNPQLHAEEASLEIQKYLKYFPDYVPDGLELKLITSISGNSMQLIYAPISWVIDPTVDNEYDVFDNGGIIVSINDALYRSNYSPEKSRENFYNLLTHVDENQQIIPRSIEKVGEYDALVLLQDGKYKAAVLLHDRIYVGAMSASFDSEETYKMVQKAIGEELP